MTGLKSPEGLVDLGGLATGHHWQESGAAWINVELTIWKGEVARKCAETQPRQSGHAPCCGTLSPRKHVCTPSATAARDTTLNPVIDPFSPHIGWTKVPTPQEQSGDTEFCCFGPVFALLCRRGHCRCTAFACSSSIILCASPTSLRAGLHRACRQAGQRSLPACSVPQELHKELHLNWNVLPFGACMFPPTRGPTEQRCCCIAALTGGSCAARL